MGAEHMGVIEKRLDAQAAPLGEFPVTGGMALAMIEFRGLGRARLRTPLNWSESGSFCTSSAAARVKCQRVVCIDKKDLTECLVSDGVTINLDRVANDGPTDLAPEICNLEGFSSSI
jgi:hypothetical protein